MPVRLPRCLCFLLDATGSPSTSQRSASLMNLREIWGSEDRKLVTGSSAGFHSFAPGGRYESKAQGERFHLPSHT